MLTPEQIAKSGTEHAEQSALFAWAATSGFPELRWMHAIPNGGERNQIVAARMKAEGAKAGVFDIFLPYPLGKFAGCYIEMKKRGRQREKNGGLSDEQVLFQEWARNHYYCTFVCYSWTEGASALQAYLNGSA